MRAAVLREGRVVYRDDVPDPTPGPGQVLVGVRSCGICGSDLHFAAHTAEMVSLSAQLAASLGVGDMRVDLSRDIIMGHEFSAEVLEAGPDTDTHAPGTLVTSLPVLASTKGIAPIGFSDSTVGAYAERMLLSAPLLVPIPNGLDPRHAALTEPMSVGLHAVNKSDIQPGETALVLGCGPIGIAIIAALHTRGVETIVASDFSPKRRELAVAMGAHQAIDPAEGSPFDTVKPKVVYEAVGVPGIIDDVMLRAMPGTRIVVAGVCMQPDTVHPFFAIAKEINVQFVLAQTPTEFADSLRSIAEGDIDVTPVITGDVGLEDVGTAFDDLADPERHCKILVTP
jgi:threonine dehydrogenase-like Zn-dependent dehydrogenase